MKPQQMQAQLSRVVSEAITHLSDPRVPLIVTVEHVTLTPDYGLARVYVSSINADMSELLAALQHARGFLQRQVAEHLRMRRTPVLEFYSAEEKPFPS